LIASSPNLEIMIKKFTASVLLGLQMIILIPTVRAANSDINFLSALSNLGDIHDYKLVQSIYGTAEFEENEDHVSVEYRLSLSGAVDGGNRTDSFNRISATLNFMNHNEVSDSTPFKKMTVQANGEIITQNQEDIFFKLNNLSIGLDEPLPFAVVDIENVGAMADLYRGTWYHTSATTLANESIEGESVDLEEYKAIEEQMKNDPKGGILELADLILSNPEVNVSEEEKDNILAGIQKCLEVELFTQRDLLAGKNKGFVFFNLNKGAIIKLLEEVAGIFGEEISAADKTMIRGGLGKFSLSGLYRIEDSYNVVDALLARLKLRDIGPLKNLEMNYRYKISELNKENSIKAPTGYEEWYGPLGGSGNELYHEDEWYGEGEF